MTSPLKFFASALGSAVLLAGAASAQGVNETINPSLVQQGSPFLRFPSPVPALDAYR
jgi:hypothetical protein